MEEKNPMFKKAKVAMFNEAIMPMFEGQNPRLAEAMFPAMFEEIVPVQEPVNNTALEYKVDQVKVVQPYNRMTAKPGTTVKSATNMMKYEEDISTVKLNAMVNYGLKIYNIMVPGS